MVRRLNSSAGRSSCPDYSVKKVCWKISQSSQENICAGFPFEQSCRGEAIAFVKRIIQRRRFPVNFKKFLKTPIQSIVCERLLLDWKIHTKLLNVFYTLTIIFSVECRRNSLSCHLFSSVSLYAFDFKFYIQGYILIRSIVALSQLKLFHEC